ncbi:MAG: ribosome maturation factor RimP [Buchananella hordeovulneris]|nr:ribosome maturation factor RimP [Buchananella hordeovulneris]
MAQPNGAQLQESLTPVVADLGLFLENVTLGRSGKYTLVRVIIDLPDGPGSVDSDQLVQATGAVSSWLDEHDPIPGRYTLEVSTPGAERVLTTARDYRRAQGRLIKAVLEGREVEGRLESVGEENVVVNGEEIQLASIVKARVVLEFSRD